MMETTAAIGNAPLPITAAPGSIDLRAHRHPTPVKGTLSRPEFDDVAQERRWRLERLAASFRLFAHFGYDEGVAGHITVRDPEFPDMFWVNPLGVYFGHMQVSDLLLVGHDGTIVQGSRPVNRAAFAIHSRLHMARPDVMAAAHSHSLYGRTFSSLGRTLDPITQDSCAFFDDQVVFSGFSGVVAETSEGDRIAETLGQKSFAILQNHGLLTTGSDIDIACWFFLSMEKCCQSQLMAEAAGTPTIIPDEIAKKTKDYIASDLSAWISIQPLYDMIFASQPDVLD